MLGREQKLIDQGEGIWQDSQNAKVAMRLRNHHMGLDTQVNSETGLFHLSHAHMHVCIPTVRIQAITFSLEPESLKKALFMREEN